MEKPSNDRLTSSKARVLIILCLGLALILGVWCWRLRAEAGEREEELARRITALSRQNSAAEQELKQLQDESARRSAEAQKTRSDLEQAKAGNEALVEQVKTKELEYGRLQELGWDLQRRLLTDARGRRAYNQTLRALWPLIEKRAPDFVSRYRKIFSGFGPDGFISEEFDPAPFDPEPDEQNTWGNYFYNCGREEAWKDCVWSPDRTRCIWTRHGCEGGDAASEVRYINQQAQIDWRIDHISYGGLFENLTWLDNHTFMYVHSCAKVQWLEAEDFRYYDVGVCGPSRLVIWKVSSPDVLSRIGGYEFPPEEAHGRSYQK